MLLGIAAALLLSGCAGMEAKQADTNAMKGRSVDDVIAELKGKGLTCGRKYEKKVVNSSKIAGTVGCGASEVAVICPVHYGIAISFDLLTNKVESATKLEGTSCF